MARFLAGAAATFLLLTGAFLFWQGRAEQAAALPAPPPATGKVPLIVRSEPLKPPEATPKSREEKRFDRADRDNDGRITREERLSPRRKAFAKLDKNGNGTLSFEEWAVRTIDKFEGADADHSDWLTPAEYATTAPKPRKKARCGC